MFVVVYKHVIEIFDGVNTWSKLDGCMDIQVLSYSVQKYLLIIMYCEVCYIN